MIEIVLRGCTIFVWQIFFACSAIATVLFVDKAGMVNTTLARKLLPILRSIDRAGAAKAIPDTVSMTWAKPMAMQETKQKKADDRNEFAL